MTAVEGWTLAIAVAAFVLAALNTAWTVYRDLLDRHKITVSVQESKLYPLSGSIPTEEPQPVVVISASNAGRRPVTVTSFNFKKANSKECAFLILEPSDPRSRCFDQTPKELQEGQVATQFIPSKNLEGIEIEYFFVSDTLGREWKSRRFPLRRNG